MILVFGGAYQGKLDYAVKRFGLAEGDIYRCRDDDAAAPGSKRAIYELDKWILALIEEGIDSGDAIRNLIAENGSAVIICNDISCGVVPEDPMSRKWREAVGRALAEIAGASDEVVRLFCGIASKLKE